MNNNYFEFKQRLDSKRRKTQKIEKNKERLRKTESD